MLMSSGKPGAWKPVCPGRVKLSGPYHATCQRIRRGTLVNLPMEATAMQPTPRELSDRAAHQTIGVENQAYGRPRSPWRSGRSTGRPRSQRGCPAGGPAPGPARAVLSFAATDAIGRCARPRPSFAASGRVRKWIGLGAYVQTRARKHGEMGYVAFAIYIYSNHPRRSDVVARGDEQLSATAVIKDVDRVAAPAGCDYAFRARRRKA